MHGQPSYVSDTPPKSGLYKLAADPTMGKVGAKLVIIIVVVIQFRFFFFFFF